MVSDAARVNNFWWGKGLAAVTTPVVLMFFFYCYLGIALPIYGHGFLLADIASGVLGVLAGNLVSYRVLTAPEKGKRFSRIGLAIFMAMGTMFIAFTYYPPRLFVFENFAQHRYNGEYGIPSHHVTVLGKAD